MNQFCLVNLLPSTCLNLRQKQLRQASGFSTSPSSWVLHFAVWRFFSEYSDRTLQGGAARTHKRLGPINKNHDLTLCWTESRKRIQKVEKHSFLGLQISVCCSTAGKVSSRMTLVVSGAQRAREATNMTSWALGHPCDELFSSHWEFWRSENFGRHARHAFYHTQSRVFMFFFTSQCRQFLDTFVTKSGQTFQTNQGTAGAGSQTEAQASQAADQVQKRPNETLRHIMKWGMCPRMLKSWLIHVDSIQVNWIAILIYGRVSLQVWICSAAFGMS